MDYIAHFDEGHALWEEKGRPVLVDYDDTDHYEVVTDAPIESWTHKGKTWVTVPVKHEGEVVTILAPIEEAFFLIGRYGMELRVAGVTYDIRPAKGS